VLVQTYGSLVGDGDSGVRAVHVLPLQGLEQMPVEQSADPATTAGAGRQIAADLYGGAVGGAGTELAARGEAEKLAGCGPINSVSGDMPHLRNQ
jgi:hypothetical protein